MRHNANSTTISMPASAPPDPDSDPTILYNNNQPQIGLVPPTYDLSGLSQITISNIAALDAWLMRTRVDSDEMAGKEGTLVAAPEKIRWRLKERKGCGDRLERWTTSVVHEFTSHSHFLLLRLEVDVR